jgi:hypothetical protein
MLRVGQRALICVERATQPRNELIRRKAQGPPSHVTVRPKQYRCVSSGLIGARDRSVIVLHHGLRPGRIRETALAVAALNARYPEPNKSAPRRIGAGVPIRGGPVKQQQCPVRTRESG